MNEEYENQIELWQKLRDQSDRNIRQSLNIHFPRRYGYPKCEYFPSRIQEEKLMVGRALLTHARSDLIIKTIQMLTEKHAK